MNSTEEYIKRSSYAIDHDGFATQKAYDKHNEVLKSVSRLLRNLHQYEYGSKFNLSDKYVFVMSYRPNIGFAECVVLNTEYNKKSDEMRADISRMKKAQSDLDREKHRLRREQELTNVIENNKKLHKLIFHENQYNVLLDLCDVAGVVCEEKIELKSCVVDNLKSRVKHKNKVTKDYPDIDTLLDSLILEAKTVIDKNKIIKEDFEVEHFVSLFNVYDKIESEKPTKKRIDGDETKTEKAEHTESDYQKIFINKTKVFDKVFKNVPDLNSKQITSLKNIRAWLNTIEIKDFDSFFLSLLSKFLNLISGFI